MQRSMPFTAGPRASRSCAACIFALAATALDGPAFGQAQPAAVVEMTSALTFQPSTVEIAAGETVEWRNASNIVHTVTANPASASDSSFVSLPPGVQPFDSGPIAAGGTFSRTFDVAGRYDYFCIPHQTMGMRGTVIVSETAGGGPADPIPDAIGASTVQVRLARVLDGLVAPNWGTAAPGLPTHLFVVDQPGQVHALELATGQASVFLDVADRLVELGVAGPDSFDERGLLGLAFHPSYQTNGLLYTYTSESATGVADFTTLPPGTAPNHQSVVTEWHVPVPADPASTPDPASARVLLRIDQPQFNHNAGALVFDEFGWLLIALGDGGNADDQGVGHVEGGNAQAPSNPLGGILRIDPFGRDSPNGQYGIPSANPFIGQPGVVPELYAYGFRNPFRVSIDPVTSELWVADAGQNDIEEVNRVTPGGNYGWNVKEGSFFFDPNGEGAGFVTDQPPPGGVPPGLVDPIAEYDHDEGIAVVGGFVYRGTAVPELVGRYVFGDHGSEEGGRLFVLDQTDTIEELGVAGEVFTQRVLGFGRDAAGELYVLANDTGTPFGATGAVLRIAPGPGAVSFDASGVVSVVESAGSVTIGVARGGGAAGAAAVDFSVSGGSAEAGRDYAPLSGTLSWADGEAGPKAVTITIVGDSVAEPVETIELVLTNATGASLGSRATFTVSIADDDAPGGVYGRGAFGALVALPLAALLVVRRRADRRGR